MRTAFGGTETDRDQMRGPGLVVVVGTWGLAMCFIPLHGGGLGAAGVGAVAVLLIGCFWVPKRMGLDHVSLGWRLPIVGLTLLAALALLIPGVSPSYAYLGEAARLGCMFAGVALTGAAIYILKRLPRVGPHS